jgi:hypothetical protein
MHGIPKALFIILAALNAWIALGYLVFVVDAGALPASDLRVPATMFLLVLAPALTFIPLARLLNAALYEVEGILGWASFGFVLTFVTPGSSLTRSEFLIFLLPLVVVIATLATLVSYAFGYRIYRGTTAQRDFLRARRQGYGVGLVVVALFLLHGIQVLSLVNGVLLVTIAVLCEVVMLSRARPVHARNGHQRRSPRQT